MKTILDNLDYDVTKYLYETYFIKIETRIKYNFIMNELKIHFNHYKKYYCASLMTKLITSYRSENGNVRLKKMNFMIYLRTNIYKKKKKYTEILTKGNYRALDYKREANRFLMNNNCLQRI